jgi:hypothetical protein
MFVMVTLFSLWSGWQAWVVRERLAMRKWLVENGGRSSPTTRAKQIDQEPFFLVEQVNTLPFWRRWLGDQSITSLTFPVFPAPSEHTQHIERSKRLFPELTYRMAILPSR